MKLSRNLLSLVILLLPLAYVHSTNVTDHVTEVKESSSLALNIILSGVLFALLLLAAFGSSYDFITKKREDRRRSRLLLSFSIRQNFMSLISLDQNRSGSINCLHGMRVLSTLGIICFHSNGFRMMALGYSDTVNEWLKSDFGFFVLSLNLCVDTFFVISAALITRSMLNDLDSGRFNFFKMTFLRYMRLTPVLALMILLDQNLGRYVSDLNSDKAFLDYSVIPCQKYWWSALLHLQVYTNDLEVCLRHSWYVSVDWQMTIFIAPVLVLLLSNFRKNAVIMIKVLIIASSLYGSEIAFQNRSQPGVDFIRQLYYPTHIRGAPYLVGILLGFNLYRFDEGSVKVGKTKTAILWSIPAGLFLTAWFARELMDESVFIEALYYGFFRVFWGIAAACIIYACYCGQSGFIDRFLSFRYWMPMAKLGYSIYMISAILQYNFETPKAVPEDLQPLSLLINFSKDLLLSVAAAVPLFLLVEEPLSLFAKEFFNLLTGLKLLSQPAV